MKRTVRILSLMVLSALMLVSCGNKKLNDSVEILNSTPVFIANERVDQKLEITDDAITVTIPAQGELFDKDGNAVDDEMIVNVFFKNMFNSPLTVMVLGNTMGTPEGSDPLEAFFSQVEKQDKVFLVEYKGKKYKLPVSLVKTILESQEKVSLPPA